MKQIRHTMDREMTNLIICIGEVVLGILLLLNPIGFASAVLMALGVLLAVMGLARLVSYWRTPPELAARGGGLVTGLIFLLAGLFCFFRWRWFVVTFPILTTVYGILTLLNGLNKLQGAVDLWRLKQRYWYVTMAAAGLTLLFGVLILADPFSTTVLLWRFIALAFLAEAVLDLVGLVLGRRTA